jgi:hypothetical protein
LITQCLQEGPIPLSRHCGVAACASLAADQTSQERSLQWHLRQLSWCWATDACRHSVVVEARRCPGANDMLPGFVPSPVHSHSCHFIAATLSHTISLEVIRHNKPLVPAPAPSSPCKRSVSHVHAPAAFRRIRGTAHGSTSPQESPCKGTHSCCIADTRLKADKCAAEV